MSSQSKMITALSGEAKGDDLTPAMNVRAEIFLHPVEAGVGDVGDVGLTGSELSRDTLFRSWG